MKKFQVLLAALAGAAAAIPGIAVTRQFPFPANTAPLFEYLLVTFSAATVMLFYLARRRIEKLPTPLVIAGTAFGAVLMLAVFIGHVWLTSYVLVEHSYENEPERQFFPLFVDSVSRSAIEIAGSRRAYLSERPKPGQASAGPAGVLAMTNERNTALTLGVLLISYTALIGSTALVFAFAGFHGLREPEVSDPPAPTPT